VKCRWRLATGLRSAEVELEQHDAMFAADECSLEPGGIAPIAVFLADPPRPKAAIEHLLASIPDLHPGLLIGDLHSVE
jgi:hypothetical protein